MKMIGLAQVAAFDNDDSDTNLARFLDAIAEEHAVAVVEIVKLGEVLSGDAVVQKTERDPFDMQAFDLIAQRVGAYGFILSKIAQKMMAAEKMSISELKACVDDVPFHSSRQRLNTALGMANIQPATDEGDDGTVYWF